MPHLHFHLTMDDEHYPDTIGYDVADLAEAHSRAILLAARVMSFCVLEKRHPCSERWVVDIEDDAGRDLMSVIVCYDTIAEAARHVRKSGMLRARA